jgi:hypothetical protein
VTPYEKYNNAWMGAFYAASRLLDKMLKGQSVTVDYVGQYLDTVTQDTWEMAYNEGYQDALRELKKEGAN